MLNRLTLFVFQSQKSELVLVKFASQYLLPRPELSAKTKVTGKNRLVADAAAVLLLQYVVVAMRLLPAVDATAVVVLPAAVVAQLQLVAAVHQHQSVQLVRYGFQTSFRRKSNTLATNSRWLKSLTPTT